MKKRITAFAFLTLISSVYAQDMGGKEKKANSLYEGFSYSEAVDKYEELGVSTIDQKRNLAISYWKIDSLQKAENLMAEVVTTDGHTADDIYNYAAILRENKSYEKSDEWMQKFAAMNVSDSRGKEYESNLGSYEQLQKDKGQFKIKNLDVNSEQQDFGATFYKDQVIFASSREGIKPVVRRWNWNGLPFLDIYVADEDNGNLSNLARFHKKVNKKFHEGPVAFTPDGATMFFTRNNYVSKSADGVNRLQLFTATYEDGKWSKPQSLPFNSAAYSCGHATISGDGKWLYFASDMPGGFGGADIYKVEMKEDGSYGDPVNLGKEVNTEGNELFPFIDPSDEMLFFSSNGKVGLGGLDVFVAQIREDKSLGKVMNLGAPVNSNRDDFSFIVDKGHQRGFFSSNREGGHGDDDIYAFEMLKPFTFDKKVTLIAVDEDGNRLEGAKFKIFDLLDEEIASLDENINHEFVWFTPDPQEFNAKGELEGYYPTSEKFEVTEEDDEVFVKVSFEKDPGLTLYALVTDKQTQGPIEGVTMIVTDNMTGDVDTVLTPSTGDYTRALSDKKLNDRGSYNLSMEKEGYLGKTVTYNVELTQEGVYEVHSTLDLTLEPIEVGGDLSKIIDINPIYFDLGKHFIRPDAATELDKIVKVMNENPNMVIELGSHTDSRGSDKSNESLSDRRAKASAAYIAERITSPERISGRGYGEAKPNTITLEDGTTQVLTEEYINSFKSKDRKRYEELHQMNRRTEFIIISM